MNVIQRKWVLIVMCSVCFVLYIMINTRFSCQLFFGNETGFAHPNRLTVDQDNQRTYIIQDFANISSYNIREHYEESEWNWCVNSTTDRDCPEGQARLQAPTAVNIGIMKSGTTALDWFLDIHEDITVMNMEALFFGQYSTDARRTTMFCNLLPCRSKADGIIVNRFPYYWMTENAASEMYRLNKNMKLLLIVRDPVERMLSHLVHYTSHNTWDVLEDRVIEYSADNEAVLKTDSRFMTVSDYANYLPEWLQYFEVNKTLLVINYAKFKSDIFNELQRIEQFLELDHKITKHHLIYSQEKKFYCKIFPDKPGLAECMGSHKGRKHPVIPDHLLPLFKNYYREKNQRFFDAIGEDFGWNN